MEEAILHVRDKVDLLNTARLTSRYDLASPQPCPNTQLQNVRNDIKFSIALCIAAFDHQMCPPLQQQHSRKRIDGLLMREITVEHPEKTLNYQNHFIIGMFNRHITSHFTESTK